MLQDIHCWKTWWRRTHNTLWLAFRRTFFSSFSRSWTQPHSLCFLRWGSTTYSAPSATALAHRPRVDPVQARCSRVQVSVRDSTALPCRWAPVPGWFEARRRLCSTSSSSLTVHRTRLSTVGDRAFPVAAARTWNSLPQHVTSAPSMSVFRGRLKAFLFRHSFPSPQLL